MPGFELLKLLALVCFLLGMGLFVVAWMLTRWK